MKENVLEKRLGGRGHFGDDLYKLNQFLIIITNIFGLC